MLIILKILLVIELAIIGPVLFYRFSRFIARVFLKEETSWKKWRFALRLNLGLVIGVYLFVMAGIGKNLISYIHSAPGNNSPETSRGETVQIMANQQNKTTPGNQPPKINPQPTESKPMVPKTKEPKTVEPNTIPASKKTTTHRERLQVNEPASIANIRMGKNRKFGVNWASVENGLKVTRMGPGPMKSAGVKIGDIITRVNGKRITNSNLLLKTRDNILYHNHPAAFVIVLRGKEELSFRLLK